MVFRLSAPMALDALPRTVLASWLRALGACHVINRAATIAGTTKYVDLLSIEPSCACEYTKPSPQITGSASCRALEYSPRLWLSRALTAILDSPHDPEREDRPDDRSSDNNARDDGSVRDDKERWRLAWHYADMTDGELESLAADSGSLTEVARRALQSELNRRGLHIEFAEPAAAVATETTGGSAKRTRKLATVCRFRDMPEALLAKSVLESAGIECLLADANIIRTDWLWSNLVGGVKLRVLEEDLEEATRILDLNPGGGDGSKPGAGDFEPPLCPRCHSAEVALGDLQEPEAAAFFTGTGPGQGDALWTCQSCGNQWRELEPTG